MLLAQLVAIDFVAKKISHHSPRPENNLHFLILSYLNINNGVMGLPTNAMHKRAVDRH